MKYIIGKKIEMSQIWNAQGQVVPVTVVEAQPGVVTQVKTLDKDGYTALQLGFGVRKKLTKPMQGHLKDLPSVRVLKEFSGGTENLKRGDTVDVSLFSPGDKVKVTGVSKGKGFQGVVRRHGFHGSPATHGHKDQLRMPGAISAGGVQHVFKGTRMAGRMGGGEVTVSNLEIVAVDKDKNRLMIKGAIPGARGSLVAIVGTK